MRVSLFAYSMDDFISSVCQRVDCYWVIIVKP